MKRLSTVMVACLFGMLAGVPLQTAGKDEPAVKKFARGAKPSPRHKLLSTPQHKILKATAAQVAYVPAKLSVWGNDTYGDCVTAEEAFAKACTVTGEAPGSFIDSPTVVAWARAHGFLDGADLTSVMDAMRSKGFQVGQQVYNDGGYSSVAYTNEAVLQSAIAQGPVKIAIDADALPSDAGSKQGWYATGKGNYPNTDHCVSICGYGPASYLYSQLNVPLPSAIPPNKSGYLVFTWGSIGFVDHDWLLGTCVESWVRHPTTVGVPPLGPPSPPNPPTPPTNGPTQAQVIAAATAELNARAAKNPRYSVILKAEIPFMTQALNRLWLGDEPDEGPLK